MLYPLSYERSHCSILHSESLHVDEPADQEARHRVPMSRRSSRAELLSRR